MLKNIFEFFFFFEVLFIFLKRNSKSNFGLDLQKLNYVKKIYF